MKSWYQIKNKSSNTGQTLDISLHDEIGYWGVSAADFISDFTSHKEVTVINLSIHSPGGNILDGFAMYNALKAHPAKVYSHVTGLAASAASTVLMAGDVITMPEDAFIMIHNPMGGLFGQADDLRDYADVMDKLKASAVHIYANRSKQSPEKIVELLDAETWMNSEDALELGFVDTVTDAIGVTHKTNFSQHFKVTAFDNKQDVGSIKNIKDFERFLRDSESISKKLATELTSCAKVIFQGDPEQPFTHPALSRLKAGLSSLNQRMG